MNNHIPGPWRVIGNREGGIKVDSQQFFIALVTDGVPGQDANARLIAAAPDLLEILELFVDCYPEQIEPLQARARRFIRKARGANDKPTTTP